MEEEKERKKRKGKSSRLHYRMNIVGYQFINCPSIEDGISILSIELIISKECLEKAVWWVDV